MGFDPEDELSTLSQSSLLSLLFSCLSLVELFFDVISS